MHSPNMSQVNTTQIISSPLQSNIPTAPQLSSLSSSTGFIQKPDHEADCKKICLDRFKYVLLFSITIQYLLFMIFAIPLNWHYLNPLKWLTELFSILCSPLSFFSIIYGIFNLNAMLKEKTYYGTRISRFIKGFSHEAVILILNVFIGLFTSRMFIRYLGDDYKSLVLVNEDGKHIVNEYYSFLLLTGIFMRFYFYYKCHDDDNMSISFSVVQQSKLSQIKRETVMVLKSSMMRSVRTTFYFIGFYIVAASSFTNLLRKIMNISDNESQTVFSKIIIFLNIRLLIYSWMLGALILCNIELVKKIINIFATQPKQFAISTKSNEITLTKALEINKFQITRHLAAQDLYILADSADSRRKQFYELSIPGAHPHNWKQLVQRTLAIVDEFNNEMKTNLEYVAKNRNNNSAQSNDVMKKFFEQKRLIRENNEMHGIRCFMTSPIKENEKPIEDKRSKILHKLKEKLLSNQVIGYLFGEQECGKLNFLLSQHSQILIWLIQGLSAIIVRSIKEDTYGIVQHDLKTIIKSLIKLKVTLDKVGAINTIVKNRNFVALRSALRRSMYRIVIEFSQFFDDMLIDTEDLRALQTFVNFKEL